MFVHLLPATPDAHFRERGGLLRLGLEVGLHAVQVADGQLFAARATVTERRALAPRWRTAAFLAGMCAGLHRAVLEVAVLGDDGARWHPVTAPLAGWLAAGGRGSYVVQWQASDEPVLAAALVALPHLLEPELVEFLETSRPCLVSEVIGALSGDPAAGSSVLGAILQQTLARIVDRDLRDRPPAHVAAMIATDSSAPRDINPACASAPPDSVLRPVPESFADSLRDPPAPEDGPAPRSAPEDTATEQAPPVVGRVRALSLPATLNPLVAEAISSLLEDPVGSGCIDTPQGIFMPLSAFARRGLDTGLVVRALHGAGLLATDRGRKVRTLGDGASSEPGIVVTQRTLNVQASLPFGG